jgi:hypothetical protein
VGGLIRIKALARSSGLASDDAGRRRLMGSFSSAMKILFMSTAVYLLALAAQHIIVPNIVPIAWAQEPQPLWAVQVAFLLVSIENTAAFVALIVLMLVAARWVQRRWQAGGAPPR